MPCISKNPVSGTRSSTLKIKFGYSSWKLSLPPTDIHNNMLAKKWKKRILKSGIFATRENTKSLTELLTTSLDIKRKVLVFYRESNFFYPKKNNSFTNSAFFSFCIRRPKYHFLSFFIVPKMSLWQICK